MLSITSADNLNEKLGVVNGLRGMAILAVIFHHLPIHAWTQTRFPIFSNTYAGVNLFFILSGFVLYRPYLLKNITTMNWNETRKFLVKRFYRLYPLFFLNCLVCLLFLYKPSLELFLSVIKTLSTYSLFFGDGYMPKINWVLWSLMVEVWFSLLFPLILLLIHKSSLLKTVIMIFFLSLLSRYVMQYTPFGGHSLMLFTRLDDFLTGFLLCYLYYTNVNLNKIIGWLYFALSIVFLLLACWCDTYLASIIPTILKNNLFQAGFSFLLLFLLCFNTWLKRIFELKFLQLAGMMCFSLYVWHGVLIFQMIQIKFNPIDYLYYSIAVLSLSVITYRFVEFRKEESLKKLFLFI